MLSPVIMLSGTIRIQSIGGVHKRAVFNDA